MQQMYHALLYRLNIGVDFVFPDSGNFTDYRVLVVPPLYVASDELLKKLHGLCAQRRAPGDVAQEWFRNEYSTVRWEMAPGPLREAAGFHYQEFTNLGQPLALKGDRCTPVQTIKLPIGRSF